MGIAELVFLRDDHNILHLRLDRAEVCIGSNPTNDVVVPDPSVPDVAALLIDRGAKRFRLRDLTGGKLSVNARRIDADEIEIENGDLIRIGPYDLRLQVRAEEPDIRQRFSRTAVFGQDERARADAVVTYQGERVAISPDRPFNIGSAEDNDLVVGDEFVSSFHCRITHQNGRWFVADLESTNGTEVNSLKVKEAELPVPATIRAGRAIIGFDLASRPAGVGPEPEPSASPRKAKSFRGMIAGGMEMQRCFELIKRLAGAREAVLVIGESGSGKELVARALHDESTRAAGPFLALNCSALSSTLIEAELFGHTKGAFTGAVADKPGAFEAAAGGTLFLDEIGELPLELQPKLLRVLESSTVRRVGGTREIEVDTRIVAATHRNLEELVERGEFREDLFHRLFVLSIRVPPLRDRAGDILPLAQHFLESHAPERRLVFDKNAEAELSSYPWPGNIRELRNIIVRSILMTDGAVIRGSDLQFSKDAFAARRDARGTVRQLEQDERQRIIEILEKTDGNRAEAARILGLSKSTFHDRLKRYGIPQKYR